jgi:hypothetical protein
MERTWRLSRRQLYQLDQRRIVVLHIASHLAAAIRLAWYGPHYYGRGYEKPLKLADQYFDCPVASWRSAPILARTILTEGHL